MPINITVPDKPQEDDLRPLISVIGVGGAGGNAVNNMIASELEGVDFIVANTDAQALRLSRTERRIQLGAEVTKGLGAGAKADVGRAAAEESMEEVIQHIGGANMVFIAAGMGGGTGTGAAPVIARAAREQGILTVGVVTKPFHFEGAHRMRMAEQGIEELADFVDTLIIIPNQNLFRVANERTTFSDAFKMADDVLYSGVRGITDLMVMPGLINLDFADVRSVMAGMGKAMMGTGEAEGERRALDAAEAAISNPLLDDSSMQGARGVLINITGGPDMTLFEVDEAANRIRAEVDQDAYIIFGSTFDERMEGTMRVSVVATGIESAEQRAGLPVGAIVTEARAKPATKPVVRPVQAAPAAPEVKAAPVEAVKAEAKPEPEAPKVEAPKVEVSKAEAVEPVAEARPVFSRPEPVAEAEPELDVEEEITEVATPVAETESDADADAVKAASVQVEPVATQPAFIPPEPVRPASAAPASVAPAEPFAAAALANASEARPEPAAVEAPITPKGGRRLSLFERVTGIGGKKEASGTEAIDPLPFQSAAPAPVAPKPMPPKPMAPAQSALGGLTQAEQLPESQEQDDLLEIPAFLRRQAN